MNLKEAKKLIFVNMQMGTVRMFSEQSQNWETCNFYEAGIIVKEKDAIEEHLIERESEYSPDAEIKVIFE